MKRNVLSFYLFLVVFGSNTPSNAEQPPTLDNLFIPVKIPHIRASSVTYTFAGSAANSINRVQLCIDTTSNACSHCHSPITISAGTPISYSTSGTSYSINPTAAAALITAGGYSTSGTPTYYIGMKVQSKDLKCNSNTQYCSASTDTTGTQNLCLSAAYNNGTLTTLTRVDNGSVNLTTAVSQYAYLGDATSFGLYKCSFTSGGAGALTSCAITPTSNVPSNLSVTGVAFTTVNGTQFAYLSDIGNTAVWNCTIGTNGNISSSIGNCNSNTSGLAGAGPAAISIATIGGTQYAYVSDASLLVLHVCAINSTTGALGTCTTVNGSSIGSNNTTDYVAIRRFNGTNYAYVSLYSGGVYQCSINNSNGLPNTPCTLTADSGGSPYQVSFTWVNGTQYAYIADLDGPVYKCSTNSSTGALSNCTTQSPSGGAPWANPIGISFAVVEGTQYAYITDAAGATYVCTITLVSGALNTCSSTPSVNPGWTPQGNIDFASF